MGLFDKLFNKKERIIKNNGSWETLTAYRPQFIPFNTEVYNNELIRSAINVKASHISKLSVDIQGAAQPKMKTQLRSSPNDFMTWSQFLYRVSTIYDVYNNCIIIPILNSYGETIGLYPVIPQNCTVVDYDGEPYLRYQFMTGKQAAIEMSKCGILKKHQLRDDIFGENNCCTLRPTMEMIDLQNQAIKEGVKNSATYRFMAQVNNYLLDDDLAKEKKSFNEKQLDSENGGGILLFPNNYENIKQIDSHPFTVDKDTIANIQSNIYGYFNVNEAILQSKANEDEMDAFYNSTIEPFAIQLSEVLTKMLFTRQEINIGNRIIITSNRLQYMSISNKVNMAGVLADRGILTVGEIRELFNYSKFGDERDDVCLARGEYANTATAERMTGVEIIGEEGEENAGT